MSVLRILLIFVVHFSLQDSELHPFMTPFFELKTELYAFGDCSIKESSSFSEVSSL
jgi:hypothetical protein